MTSAILVQCPTIGKEMEVEYRLFALQHFRKLLLQFSFETTITNAPVSGTDRNINTDDKG